MNEKKLKLRFKSLPGLVPYRVAQEEQRKWVDQRAADEIPDTVLFLEHEPVVTQGRGLQWTGTPRERHIPLAQPLPPQIAFCESERGGDLTYHGPGQLVVYPICKLDGQGFGPNHDVAGFLRKLESTLIAVLARLSLRGEAHADATGVWVGDQKLASIGIAVRKWVTYHGMAINVVNDLKPFHLISPCGFSPEVMTSLKELAPAWANENGGNWRSVLEELLRVEFEAG